MYPPAPAPPGPDHQPLIVDPDAQSHRLAGGAGGLVYHLAIDAPSDTVWLPIDLVLMPRAVKHQHLLREPQARRQAGPQPGVEGGDFHQ